MPDVSLSLHTRVWLLLAAAGVPLSTSLLAEDRGLRVLAALAGAGAVWLAAEISLLRPLRALARAGQRLLGGDLATRAGLAGGRGELGRIAAGLEQMATDLAASPSAERKGAETALRESEERYRSVVAAVAEGVVVIDAEGTVQAANESAERILGVPRECLEGAAALGPLRRAVGEDGSPLAQEDHPCRVTLRTGRPVTNEVLGIERPDGARVWVSARTQPLRAGEAGAHRGVVFSFADLGELRQANVALESTRLRLEEVVAERTCELRRANADLQEEVAERRRAEDALRLDEARLEALLRLHALAGEAEAEITGFALEEAVRLTGSEIGYLHFVHSDERTIHLHSWSKRTLERCAAVVTSHYPVDQAGVWVDCVRERRPVVHNDYPSLTGARGLPEGHVPLSRHLGVPVFDRGRIVAVAGVGNKPQPYDDADVRQLTLFMDGMWSLLQRRRADEAASESEGRYRALFESSHAVTLLVDPADGRIVDANPAACSYYGYPREELTGRHVTDINTLSLGEVRVEMELARAQRRRHFLFQHRLAAGEVRDVEVFSGPLRLGGRELLHSIVHDVTDRRRAERALRESERRFRDTLENVQLLAVGLDTEGHIAFCNDSLLRLAGYSRAEVLGRDWFTLFLSDGDALREAFRNAVARGTVFPHLENDIVTRDGRRRTVEWNNVLLRDEDGSVLGTASIGQDVTEGRAAAAEVSRRTRQLSALYRVSRESGESLDLDEVLGSGVRATVEALDVDAGAVFLRADDATLSMVSQHDLPGSLAVAVDTLDEGEGLAGRAVAERRAVVVDVDGYPADRLSAPVRDAGFRTLASAPLLAGGEVIGALTLGARRSAAFSPEDRELLATVGQLLGAAVQKARLHEQVQDELIERRRAEEDLRAAASRLAAANAELEHSREALKELATTDELTGLLNRREMNRLLAEELERHRRFGQSLGIALIDLDHFKAINDTHGHTAGDEALRWAARLLKENLRGVDRAARYGGDELLLLLPGARTGQARRVAERFRRLAQANPLVVGADRGEVVQIRLGLSIGVASLPEDAATAEALLAAADRALYQAKRSGRNRTVSAGGRSPTDRE